MLAQFFKPLKLLSAAILLLCMQTALAQDKYTAINHKIDSLSAIGLPKSALTEVDKLDSTARQNNNVAQQIKAAIYRMNFQSYVEENALAAIIERLKTDVERADFPAKKVLQSLLAETYWKYYQQNRYQFGQRTQLETPGEDFTRWSLPTIIKQTGRLYQLSLSEAQKEQNTPVDILDGVLTGDKTTRNLRPTLYDLLVQRALNFYLSEEPGLVVPKLPFKLNDNALFGDSRTFANLSISTADTASSFYQGLKYLQQATLFHLKNNNDEAVADIDMQRLRFLKNRATVDNKNVLYVSALKQIADNFSTKPISAQALLLLGEYYQGVDSLITARSYFKKASDNYPESIDGKNAIGSINSIDTKTITATTEAVNSPGKPLLALVQYKNVSSVKAIVYRLSAYQLQDYNANISTYNNTRTEKIRDFISKLTAIQTHEIKLSGTEDYRTHSTEIKIDPLPAGNYLLLVKDGQLDDPTLTGITTFKVTRLAYVLRMNPDEKAQIVAMDRETGEPLNGVKISLGGRTRTPGSFSEWVSESENGTTNNEGLFITAKQFNSPLRISLDFKSDTLIEQQYVYGAKNNEDENDAEDRTLLFTDRQIYRPGQTIYFKGLQLQVLNGKNKIMPGKNVEVTLNDVNRKSVSSLKLKTNEFGTFSGSFILPESMLGGSIEIKTNDGSVWVMVEEYKRPTFLVEFLPVKESYKLNDTISVKGKVTAYSGYGISKAKVAYHVVGTTDRNYYPLATGKTLNLNIRRDASQVEIKTDTVITDNNGNYEVKFKSTPGITRSGNYTYGISADVTDASGETRSAQTSVTVGNNNILIEASIPAVMIGKDSIAIPLKINNLNGQPQKGEVTVEVYALQNPDRVYKTRLWQKPDQHSINKTDFNRDFPEFAYQKEDDRTTWKKLNKVDSLHTNVAEDKPAILNFEKLRKQPPGVYQVKISARNPQGDTVSVTQYVNMTGEHAIPLNYNSWVTPVLNAVKPGIAAEFLVGTGDKTRVLMERYNGPKLISSRWLTIEKGQQTITVPVSATDKDPAVQFMMVYQNRSYSSYQKIYTIKSDEDLQIKFLTFRNKLQPGEKEQWKLQISNSGEKQAAEMVAALYDASLDDIAQPQNWPNMLERNNRYQPNYFAWSSYGFVNAVSTNAIAYRSQSYYRLARTYETLDLLGYNYYGGYNYNYRNYLQKVKANLSVAESDRALENEYLKNAALIKNGYIITGKVVDDKGVYIAGVGIQIKGTTIKTTTNSKGEFKIKVPAKGTLLFSYIGYRRTEISTTKAEKISVRMKVDENTLNEVVVVGYGTVAKQTLTGAVATLNGKDFAGGNIGAARASLPADILKEVQIIDDYGDQASRTGIREDVNKVYNSISIRGNNAANVVTKPITIRKNFNETAFFYPQLQTDSKGEILINFTIPEALTKWRFKAFAHTKQLQTGYIENEIVTQKQLSITANMPRFLREGDTITVSARVVNLTAGALKGKVSLQLFNGLTMQPVSILKNSSDAEQSFDIAALLNKAVSFKLVIPLGLDAITYRLTASAGKYSDGEESTIPVLPNSTLVTEAMPMMVRAGQTRVFNFDKLINNKSTTLQSKTLTLEYTQNPAWYAVQAMPYLMDADAESSEQLFSRYYANSMASNLVNTMPVIKQVFDRWKSTNSAELLSNLEKNAELKTTILAETPWLRDAISETEQKKRIALLFDLNKISSELKTNLDKLQKRQLSNGGFTWFAGDVADRYITQYILAGIGRLYSLNIADDKNQSLKNIKENALTYLDFKLVDDDKKDKNLKNYDTQPITSTEVHAWYARSYFTNQQMSAALKSVYNNYLKRVKSQWVTQSVFEQGMIGLTMQRNNEPVLAQAIIKSLGETAQQSDELGMYWGKNQTGYYWYQSPIETQSLLIEFFTAMGKTAEVDEMKIWLLRNKQTNNWKTTKATAAACFALLSKQGEMLSTANTTQIKVDKTLLADIKPDVKAEAGTGYIKTNWVNTEIKPGLGAVEVNNTGKTVTWGAMYWQYLERLDKITPSQTDIKLERKYYILKQTDSGPLAVLVDAANQPKVGDVLKVIVNLKAGRDFEYVQLKDMRPAGTEPVSILSQYKYQDGLYYYQVTKDVATNFFIDRLNKGNYVFEYQLRVSQPGDFSTGVTNVQCLYAPEFSATSNGSRLKFK